MAVSKFCFRADGNVAIAFFLVFHNRMVAPCDCFAQSLPLWYREPMSSENRLTEEVDLLRNEVTVLRQHVEVLHQTIESFRECFEHAVQNNRLVVMPLPATSTCTSDSHSTNATHDGQQVNDSHQDSCPSSEQGNLF